MAATVFTEAVHPLAPLIQAVHDLSVDEVIIAASQTIVVGQVLGAVGTVASETATPVNRGSNTGNGVCTVASIGTGAVNGLYTIEFETAGAGATFELIDPNGAIVGKGVAGTAFTSAALNFTVSNGGTAWAIGDLVDITVTRAFGETGEQYEAWNPAATDGSQIAVAIALYPVTTGAGVTARIAALRRDGVARASDLTWNGSATATQIAFATQQLAAKNIVLR